MPDAAHPDNISIHALREEGDSSQIWESKQFSNFYPRPPRGGRHDAKFYLDMVFRFLSTPSARRATSAEAAKNRAWQISIHALREEGDYDDDHVPTQDTISIHALREEGDLQNSTKGPESLPFLSTPSARRATRKLLENQSGKLISIHALREEGDPACIWLFCS